LTTSWSVAVPAVLNAFPKLAVQDIVVVPQPDEIATVARPFVFGATVKGAVPVSVKVTGAIAVLTLTVWVAPLAIAIVGAGGSITVIVAAVDAVRFAPSVAIRVTVAPPIWPTTGRAEIIQATPTPQFEGVKVTPAVPWETRVAGISEGLLL
jgi:hypothetical protein